MTESTLPDDQPLDRAEICLSLVTVSPLHIGDNKPLHQLSANQKKDLQNDDESKPVVSASTTDTPLACMKTDTDIPLIPGSTARGLLRNALESWCCMHGESDVARPLLRMLGEQQEASAMQVMDALATRYQTRSIARVAIDPVTATAASHQLFSKEVVQPDSAFELRIKIRNPDGSPVKVELLHRLIALLDVFNTEPLGADRSVGFGIFFIEGPPVCKYITAEKYTAWLLDPSDSQLDEYSESCTSVPSESDTYPSPRFTQIPFVIKQLEPVLVNDPEAVAQHSSKQQEDNKTSRKGQTVSLIAMQRGNQCIVPGSSIKGVFKANLRRILNTVNPATTDETLALFFGDSTRGFGALRFYEASGTITGTENRTMVKSDRHTALVVPFVAKGIWTDALHSSIGIDLARLTGPRFDFYVCLLLHCLRDWLEEDISSGWGTTRGFGLVYAYTGTTDPRHTDTPWESAAEEFMKHLYQDKSAIPGLEQLSNSLVDPTESRPEQLVPQKTPPATGLRNPPQARTAIPAKASIL